MHPYPLHGQIQNQPWYLVFSKRGGFRFQVEINTMEDTFLDGKIVRDSVNESTTNPQILCPSDVCKCDESFGEKAL